MQVPKRRSQERRKYGGPADDFLSPSAIRKLESELRRLEASRPRAVEDLSRARDMGDLSENAAYSHAKGRLMRIDAVIFETREKLKHAIVIRPGADAEGRARVGSTVVVEINGKERTYEITGSQETDPSSGRVSYLSPLGAALLGRKADEKAIVKGPKGPVTYRIIAVS